MTFFIIKRIFWMIPTLLFISIISFIIIQLPPGDFLTSYISALEASGQPVAQQQVQALREQYDLDKPLYVQYFKWLRRFISGDFGTSFEWKRPVGELIGERFFITIAISILTLLFTWVVAIPIGIYSAVKQYSIGDYFITLIGFIGLAIPSFLLALVIMYASYRLFGTSPGGLFSPQYQQAQWSWAKLVDMVNHLWIPIIVIGMAGTASLIRIMRANLLDELKKQYVITAIAKGVHPVKLLFKYPVRVAVNPIISTAGWLLPQIVSGAVITSVVLGLPPIGPLFLRALMNQDMYLAGCIIMMLSFLTVLGTLISDILLVILDPRIAYDKKA